MVRFAAATLALAASMLGLSAHGSNEILLLEFSSPTCGPCRQMEPLIHAYLQAGYPIRKVDTTAEPDMARNFQITKVPCFVMLVEGREIRREIGMLDTAQLQAIFQQAKDVYIASHKAQPSRPAAPADPESTVETDWAPDSTGGTSTPEPELPLALVNSTVRLRMEDSQGRSFGTGTIIDAREGEALIVTCGHLFRESQGKGPVSVELFEATPAGVRVVGQVTGQVITYDLERDVALVGIRPGRPVTVARIAPRNNTVSRGDRVVSIGCSNGQSPTVLPSRINDLDRYQGPPNIEVAGAPVEGRSGGGLFNDRGELIGICYAADREGNEGLYAALQSIHDEIDRLQLPPNGAIAAAGVSPTPAAQSADAGPIYRGQGGQEMPTANPAPPVPDREQGSSLAATSAAGPNGRLGSMPSGLDSTEKAAWQEIDRLSAESEVTIIVQPRTLDGESQIFTLRGASPAFVRGLAERQGAASDTVRR